MSGDEQQHRCLGRLADGQLAGLDLAGESGQQVFTGVLHLGRDEIAKVLGEPPERLVPLRRGGVAVDDRLAVALEEVVIRVGDVEQLADHQ